MKRPFSRAAAPSAAPAKRRRTGVVDPSPLALQALDYLALPLLLLSAEGRVVHCNRAATEIVRRREGLAVVRGQLVSEHASSGWRLAAAIGRALEAAEAGRWEILHLPRRSAEAPLALALATLAHRRHGKGVAIYIIDPGRCLDLALPMIAGIHRLSGAEARVAAALLRCDGVDQIAAELHLSSHTVRTHLKNILARHGVHRQSELVRLLVAGAGSFFVSEPLQITSNGRCADVRGPVESFPSSKDRRGRS